MRVLPNTRGFLFRNKTSNCSLNSDSHNVCIICVIINFPPPFVDVMNEGWLEDRLGLLSNMYITLMQGEVDRFQDTVRMLKDYYKGMEGKIPEEFSPEYARIPLIDVIQFPLH